MTFLRERRFMQFISWLHPILQPKFYCWDIQFPMLFGSKEMSWKSVRINRKWQIHPFNITSRKTAAMVMHLLHPHHMNMTHQLSLHTLLTAFKPFVYSNQCQLENGRGFKVRSPYLALNVSQTAMLFIQMLPL